MKKLFDTFYIALKKRHASVKLARFSKPYKLHLGCGEVRFDGWVNVDADPRLAAVDLVWDLSLRMPVDDSSCQVIYCEHFLEHLTVEQGVAFLRECRRVLVPGGVLRVAMPSLDYLIDKICHGDWRDQDWLSWPGHEFIKTRAEMLNISFRWWGHQWLYDREEFHRRLEEAGFQHINDVEWGESDMPELRQRETRKDSKLICEVTI
jgi:predicted SAM-dependent methyltransferase